MSHSSPASYLVWTLLSAVVGVFLLFHLWSFDRFKCLRWNSGASSGAFKRVMTYSYMITVPLVFSYAFGNMAIKYSEGFIDDPTHGIIPKPYQLWKESSRASIFPLTVMFSIGWSLEMVTHLEELCFWLFLVNSGSAQQHWFHSHYFKTWIFGSILAIIYMPVITVVSRADPLKSEGYTFLAGSLGSLSLTIWFIPILWTFPSFLQNLKNEGVDINTIVRLTKFSELNMIRVVFRLLFTVPVLILGVDGLRPHGHINESMLWTDFLIMLAGFGCSISSAITLVIFFPRSIEGEIAAREAAKNQRRARSGRSATMADMESTQHHISSHTHAPSSAGGTYILTSSPVKRDFSPDDHYHDVAGLAYHPEMSQNKVAPWEDERDTPAAPAALLPIRPVRKNTQARDIERGAVETLTETNLSAHNLRMANVNPMLQNFRSPIYLYEAPVKNNVGSRLTFSRK